MISHPFVTFEPKWSEFPVIFAVAEPQGLGGHGIRRPRWGPRLFALIYIFVTKVSSFLKVWRFCTVFAMRTAVTRYGITVAELDKRCRFGAFSWFYPVVEGRWGRSEEPGLLLQVWLEWVLEKLCWCTTPNRQRVWSPLCRCQGQRPGITIYVVGVEVNYDFVTTLKLQIITLLLRCGIYWTIPFLVMLYLDSIAGSCSVFCKQWSLNQHPRVPG